MMDNVSGENEFNSLTIQHLKICLNAECNAFKKSSCQVALDHNEEATENRFCHFVHDGDVLMNKDKCQAF